MGFNGLGEVNIGELGTLVPTLWSPPGKQKPGRSVDHAQNNKRETPGESMNQQSINQLI